MFVLILDNIRSCHNVGSIFRSADAFGVDEIICCGITPYPEHEGDNRMPHVRARAHKQIAKTALGAEETVPFRYVESTTQAIEQLEGVVPVALEQTEQSTPLNSFKRPDSMALIVGNEPNGISAETLAACKQFVEIPMHGHKESLNVSVATGIALFALQ